MQKKYLRPLLVGVFYLGWFGSVFSVERNLQVYSLMFPLIGFFIVIFGKEFKNPSHFICAVFLTALGMAFDYLAALLGWISFQPVNQNGFLPIWLISIWLLFLSLWPVTQDLFKKRFLIAGILAFVMGPVSYLSGEKFQVLFLQSDLVALYYAIFWCLYFSGGLYLLNQSLQKKS